MENGDLGLPTIGGTSRRKCLLGVTITLVEDSLSASEALRLMAVASGSRLRRADRLMTAERHLSLYRPNVVIVDLGLPDGSGLDLIASVYGMQGPRPGLIAFSGGDIAEWGDAARAAGAGALMPKPVGSLAVFQDTVLSVLPDRERRDVNTASVGSVHSLLSPQVKRDDLAHARKLLDAARTEKDDAALVYSAQFITSLAVMLEDDALQVEAMRLGEAGAVTPATLSAVERLTTLIDERIARQDPAVHTQAG